MLFKRTRFFLIFMCAVLIITEVVFRPVFTVKTSDFKTDKTKFSDVFVSYSQDATLYTPSASDVINRTDLPEGYEKKLDDGNNELFFSMLTGDIALKNKKTGEIWFSNETVTETNPQIRLYYCDDAGISKTMDSYTHCVAVGMLNHKVSNGVFSVEYQMGQTTVSVNDVPNILTERRFNELTDKMPESVKIDFKSNYSLISIKGVEEKDYVDEYLKEYPNVKNSDLYVLNTSNSRRLKRIYEALESIGYTSEDLKADFEENGIEPGSQSVGFTVVLDYSLKNNSLYLEIDVSKIKQSSVAKIEKLEVLRNFGAAGKNDNGYFLVPDGSGALIYFNNQKGLSNTLSLPVYGQDTCFSTDERLAVTEKCSFPVFGIKKNNNALLVSMEKGESLADINVQIANNDINLNSAYFTLNLIRSQEEKVNIKSTNVLKEKKPYTGAYVIRYTPITAENPDYIKMAEVYGNQLFELGILKENKVENSYSLLISVLGAADITKNLFVVSYDTYESLTDFEETERIANDLYNKGIRNLGMQYIGWANGGLRGTFPAKLKTNGKLGGEKGLKSLQSALKKKSITLFMNTDFLALGNKGNGYSPRNDNSKKLSTANAYMYLYNYVSGYKRNDVSPYYLVSPNLLDSLTEKFLNSADSLGIAAVSSEDLGKLLGSDFNSSKTVDRVSSQEKSVSAIKKISNNKTLALSYPNAYALVGTDMIYDIPLSSSNFKIEDESVPFYQAVVRGYVDYITTPINYAADENTAFLKAIEYGSGLNYLVNYRSLTELKNTEYNIFNRGTYSDWADIISKNAGKAQTVFEKLQGKRIIGHSRISDGVYKTEYQGGITVFVNYSEQVYNSDGVSVPPGDFTVIGGNALEN